MSHYISPHVAWGAPSPCHMEQSQELKKRKSKISKGKSTHEKTTNEDEHLNLKEYLLRYGFYKK